MVIFKSILVICTSVLSLGAWLFFVGFLCSACYKMTLIFVQMPGPNSNFIITVILCFNFMAASPTFAFKWVNGG